MERYLTESQTGAKITSEYEDAQTTRTPLGRLATRLFNTPEIPADILSDNYTADELDIIKRVMKHGTRGVHFVPSSEGSLPTHDMVRRFMQPRR